MIRKELAKEITIKRKTSGKGELVLAKPIGEVFGYTAMNLGVFINFGTSDVVGTGDSIDDASSRDGDEHINDAHEFFLKKVLTIMVILVVAMVYMMHMVD